MNLPVAILAGGLATRLRPLTERIPKSLVEVGGTPFAAHQIQLLRRHGVNHIVFCVGHLGEQVQLALGDGGRWGVRLDYSFDGPLLLGTGGALRRALPMLGESFLVLYGDSYLECDYRSIAEAFVKSGKQGLMTVFLNEDRWDKSNVVFADGLIQCYDKQSKRPAMTHIDYGLGALRADVFNAYPKDGFLDLASVYRDLAAKGGLAGYEVAERFYEIGSTNGLDETRWHLASKAASDPADNSGIK